MWISSLFVQFQFQNDKKGAVLEVQTILPKKGCGYNCEMLPRPPSTSGCHSFGIFGDFWTDLATSVHVPELPKHPVC